MDNLDELLRLTEDHAGELHIALRAGFWYVTVEDDTGEIIQLRRDATNTRLADMLEKADSQAEDWLLEQSPPPGRIG